MANVEQIAEQVDNAAAEKAAAAVTVAEERIAEAEKTTEAMALAAAHGAHAQALEAHKKEVEIWRASDHEARLKLEAQVAENKEILEKMSSILDRLSQPKPEPKEPTVTVVNPEPEPKEKKEAIKDKAEAQKRARRFL